tara:strand:+ start:216 stop:866 length:651 start_codon:yes stop_codon:yes gene_type:complete
MRAAIFDLDGTLVNSLPGIADALNSALAAQGLSTHPRDLVERFIGNGSRMLVRRGIGGEPPDALVDKIHESFLSFYSESLISGTHLYPGVRTMLKDLHLDGMPMAVCSNKPHQYTVAIMTQMFSWVPWIMVLGQKKSIPIKPDPTGALSIASAMQIPASEIAFVGDSTVDFETARAAGMNPVLVEWGFSPLEKLALTTAPLVSSTTALRKCLQAPH